MPYVLESSPSPEVTFRGYRTETGSGIYVTLPVGKARSQLGFRSGKRSQVEIDSCLPKPKVKRVWANSASLLNEMSNDSYGYTSGSVHTFAVNHREYTEYTRSVGLTDASYSVRANGTAPWTERGVRGFVHITNIPTSVPSITDTEVRNIGSSLLRSAMPVRPYTNLTRSIGELRDAPHIFKVSNYVPRNLPETAGAYLNWIFAVKPTVDDLKRTSEAVERSADIIRNYIEHENRQLRRRRSRVVDSGSSSSSQVTSPPVFAYSGGLDTQGIGYRSAYTRPSPVGSFPQYANLVTSTITYRSVVSAFGVWEYFIPHSEGLLGRLDTYVAKARQVLGGGLDLPTAYDLTPWTWLVNWFIDIGGLLRFGQAVADNNVVASRCGISSVRKVSAEVTVELIRPSGTDARNRLVSAKAGTAFGQNLWLKRLPASPYSISPNWSFTSQQAAIISALGISKGRG